MGRKGVWPTDKRPLYKFHNRTMGTDCQHYFASAEEEEYTKLNQRLGHQVSNPIRRFSIQRGGESTIRLQLETGISCRTGNSLLILCETLRRFYASNGRCMTTAVPRK